MPLARHDGFHLKGVKNRHILLQQLGIVEMKSGPVAATDRRNSIEPGKYFAQPLLASFMHSHTHALKQKNQVKHPARERLDMTSARVAASARPCAAPFRTLARDRASPRRSSTGCAP